MFSISDGAFHGGPLENCSVPCPDVLTAAIGMMNQTPRRCFITARLVFAWPELKGREGCHVYASGGGNVCCTDQACPRRVDYCLIPSVSMPLLIAGKA